MKARVSRSGAERPANKRPAATAASDALFAASPLPEVGKEAWITLWEAARRYADDVAYPGKTFPEATAGEDLCVLCQQPLGVEAVARRATFEEYVKGTTRIAEQEAVRAIASARKTAEVARMPIAAIPALKSATRRMAPTLRGDPPLMRSRSKSPSLRRSRHAHIVVASMPVPLSPHASWTP